MKIYNYKLNIFVKKLNIKIKKIEKNKNEKRLEQNTFKTEIKCS